MSEHHDTARQSGSDGVRDGDERSARLARLVDVERLQSMMHDFYALTNIPMSLIDIEGTVIVGAGWQEVCLRFHRANPETCAACIESDTMLTADIPRGESVLYKCKNGMWDAATPLFIGDERVGHLFTGQFFFADEPIDLDFFREQAKHHGFDEAAYLQAVQAVPRLEREAVEVGLDFLHKLAVMIAEQSANSLARGTAEARLRAAAITQEALIEELGTEREVLEAIMSNTDTALAYLDPDFNFVAVNRSYAENADHDAKDLIGRSHFELFPDEQNEAIFRQVRETLEPVVFKAKPFEYAHQPWRGVTYWDWRLAPVVDKRDRLKGLALSLNEVTHIVRENALRDAANVLNDVIHSDLQIDGVLAAALPALVDAMRCEAVVVMVESEAGPWTIRAAVGVPEEALGGSFEEASLPLVKQAMRAGHPLPGVPQPGSWSEEWGFQSLLAAPLSIAEGRRGALVCGFISGPGRFEAEHEDFAAKVATSLSLALQNAHLYEAERQTARLNEALSAIDRSIHSTLEFDLLLERVVVEAANAIGCESSALDLREDGEWVVQHVHRMPAEMVGARFTDEQVPFAAMAAESHAPVVVSDSFNDARVDPEVQRAYNVTSVMVTPLIVRDDVVGLIFFNYHERQHTFSESEVRFAERLSASLGLAIANARLYETERHVADRLQEALLALPDGIPGITFAHSYHASAEAARVGGDFYDVFDLGGGRVGVTVGDVAGKGLDAAVLTSLAKNTIRAHASERGKSPARILGLTNGVLYRSTPPEAFVTIFFGILDCAEGTLTYANAGHTVGAILRKGGAVEALPPTASILGAFEYVTVEEASVPIGTGEPLVLYTDGVTEARGESGFFGEERLLETLRESSGLEPACVVERMVGAVMDFTHGELRDDLAIFVLARETPPA